MLEDGAVDQSICRGDGLAVGDGKRRGQQQLDMQEETRMWRI